MIQQVKNFTAKYSIAVFVSEMKQSSIPWATEFILRMVGLWPGVSDVSGFLIISGILIFSLTFEFWNAFVVYKDLESLANSICTTIAKVMTLLKLISLRKNRW